MERDLKNSFVEPSAFVRCHATTPVYPVALLSFMCSARPPTCVGRAAALARSLASSSAAAAAASATMRRTSTSERATVPSGPR